MHRRLARPRGRHQLQGGLGVVMGNQKLLFEIVGMMIIVIPKFEVIEAQSVLGVGIDVRGFGFDPIKEAVEAIVISLAIFIA